MRNAMLLVLMLAFLCPVAVFAGEPQNEVSKDFQVMRVSPRGDRAIIRGANGKVKMVEVGDSIGEKGNVKEISKDRVVIEEMTDVGAKSVIVQPGNRRERPGK